MNYLKQIKKIKETQGTNAKLDILRDCVKDENFKKILFYTYNPFYLYYVTKIPSYTFKNENNFSLEDSFELLDTLRGRLITGNLALEKISLSLSNMDKDMAELFKLMLGRDLKMGLNVTSINKVSPNLIPTFDVMLADSGKTAEELLTENEWVYVQKKSDGKRCIAIVKNDGVGFYARSGKEIENLNRHELLINSLKTIRSTKTYDFILDGELVIENEDGSDADRQYSNGLITKKNLPKEEVEKFSFVVWDIVPLDEFQNNSNSTPYEERYYTLLGALIPNFSNLKVIPTFVAVNPEQASRITNHFIKEGFEGSIIKTPYHYYERKRSKNWMKYKVILDCDLKVVGFNYGNPGTKYEHLLGSLACQTSDGLLNVGVGAGFSDLQRNEFKSEDLIGKVVCVQYNQVIKDVNGNYSLFLPVFIEIRDDKFEADNLEKVLNKG
jgi:ATP-dependent DNA ligase